jgi:branched-chain amino acid transport system ATP-binding protein
MGWSAPLDGSSGEGARMPDVLLAARGLTRRFGGLVAVNDVSLELLRGEVHALIGTNGAGKSTLINVLSGEVAATSGRVELLGLDVTRLSQPRRALAGLGRSYQRSTIFPQFTVLENCRLAAQALFQRPWAFWSAATRCLSSIAGARLAVKRAGLQAETDLLARHLSHGKQRQLEIALCLAIQPQVLLLDEPLSGLGAEETERMLKLLAELKADHAVLLVEHDMDAIFRIADRITVMVDGEAIASDVPERVRRNPEVQRAYLGHGH